MSPTFKRRLKSLRNLVVYRGIPPATSRLLKEQMPGGIRPGEHLVNLSVDLELGFNGPFWRGQLNDSLRWGRAARDHLEDYLQFIREHRVPMNVQFVGALLDPEPVASGLFSSEQERLIRDHLSVFRLEDEEVAGFRHPWIEPGIHGYSHRPFPGMTEADAEVECRLAIQLVTDRLGRSPTFLSFPKNQVAHTDTVVASGIERWRSDGIADERGIDIGIWLAPSHVTPAELARTLRRLRSSVPGSLVHLWNHLSEMGTGPFRAYLEAVESSGFRFAVIGEMEAPGG